jgi:hypothetical protein
MIQFQNAPPLNITLGPNYQHTSFCGTFHIQTTYTPGLLSLQGIMLSEKDQPKMLHSVQFHLYSILLLLFKKNDTGIELRASGMLGKHSTTSAVPPAPLL